MTRNAKLDKRRKTYDPPIALETLMELRENEESFEIFVKHFLKPTYSKKWNHQVVYRRKKIKTIGNIVSITDEAFVLLILENNWERWIDINNQSKNKYIPSKRGREKPKVSSIMPKYTHLQVKNANAERNEDQGCKGWRESGIQRYNELCELVQDNRKHFVDVDKSLLEELNPKESPSTNKRQRKRQKSIITVKPFVEDDNDDESCGTVESNE